MINVPANEGQDWDAMKKDMRTAVLKKLSNRLKVDIEKHILFEETLDPVKLEQETGSYRGALYGSASNDKFSAFLRQPNFSNKYKNLFFCGGTVHPGGGIPLCLMSAKIVSDFFSPVDES